MIHSINDESGYHEATKPKYRKGFEPDKSTADWTGRRVRELPGSGGWDGEEGTVIATEVHPHEYGWFYMLFDRADLNERYPDGILTHSTEVELIP